MTQRRYDVDWLRVVATLAIFLFHCARFFDTEGWELKNAEQSFIVQGEGLAFESRGDLFEAEYHLTRALALSPGHPAALKYLGQVHVYKALVHDTVDATEELLKAGDPDGALAKVRRIQDLARTRPEIASLLRRSLRASANRHVGLAVAASDAEDYETALAEAKIACERLPSDPSCLAWRTRAEQHLAAVRLLAQAKQLMDQGDYEKAHAACQQALANVPAHRRIQQMASAALAAWNGQTYDAAVALEAEGHKPSLHKARELYETCESRILGFRDARERIAGVDARLAALYFDEAVRFARQPNLRRIALAYECLLRARAHRPDLPGLQAELDRVGKLSRLRSEVVARLQLDGDTPFAGKLSRFLVASLAKAHIPRLAVEQGSAQGLLQQLQRQAEGLGYAHFTQDSEAPWQVLQIAGHVLGDSAAKTGQDQGCPVVSDVPTRTAPIPNATYEDRVVRVAHYQLAHDLVQPIVTAAGSDRSRAWSEYGRAKRSHDAAAAALSSRRRAQQGILTQAGKHEAARRDLLTKVERKAANAAAARQASKNALRDSARYRQQAEHAPNRTERDRLLKLAMASEGKAKRLAAAAERDEAEAKLGRRQADAQAKQARTLRQQASAMQPEVNRLGSEEAQTARRLRQAQVWLTAADSAVAQLRRRATDYARQAGPGPRSLPLRTSQVAVLGSYTFTHRPVQVFGSVRVRAQIVALDGDRVLARPAAHVEDLKQALVQVGVLRNDVQGFRNQTDGLPSAETLHSNLQRRARTDLLAQMVRFFRGYGERYIKLAEAARRSGQVLDAMEWYLCYLAHAHRADAQSARAKAFVDEHIVHHHK